MSEKKAHKASKRKPTPPLPKQRRGKSKQCISCPLPPFFFFHLLCSDLSALIRNLVSIKEGCVPLPSVGLHRYHRLKISLQEKRKTRLFFLFSMKSRNTTRKANRKHFFSYLNKGPWPLLSKLAYFLFFFLSVRLSRQNYRTKGPL